MAADPAAANDVQFRFSKKDIQTKVSDSLSG
jgi:hypothetical protein